MTSGILMAIGTLCNFTVHASTDRVATLACQKYYAECVGDLSLSFGSGESKKAEKLRECILKKPEFPK